jgi:hypothetical protein
MMKEAVTYQYIMCFRLFLINSLPHIRYIKDIRVILSKVHHITSRIITKAVLDIPNSMQADGN